MKENIYIYNLKRKGKEYNEGKLLYEGEYLFDKKYNGKGYDKNGNIIYELINGKGSYKELYDNGKIKLEILYSKELSKGEGKEYDENGSLIFEGEYFNFKKWNGKGYDINHNTSYTLNNGKDLLKIFMIMAK